jgi:hypothetical protein
MKAFPFAFIILLCLFSCEVERNEVLNEPIYHTHLKGTWTGVNLEGVMGPSPDHDVVVAFDGKQITITFKNTRPRYREENLVVWQCQYLEREQEKEPELKISSTYSWYLKFISETQLKVVSNNQQDTFELKKEIK